MLYKGIQELTREQANLFDSFVDCAIRIYLGNSPLDKGKVERLIPKLYTIAGVKLPEKYIYVRSPMEVVQLMASEKTSTKHLLIDWQRNEMWEIIPRWTGESLRNPDTLSWQNFQWHVWNKVWKHLRRELFHHLQRDMGFQVRNFLFDYHHYTVLTEDFAYLSIYSYILASLAIQLEPDFLTLFMQTAKYCGSIMSLNGSLIICEKPRKILLDSDKRLHCNGEKAIEYSDGFGVYANHGTEIPEKYGSVKTEDWQAKWLLEEKSTEYKRILIREIGYEGILEQLPHTLIHEDGDRQLFCVKGSDIEDTVLLKVVCPSTGAVYALRVPPNMTDCEQARLWTLNIEKDKKIVNILQES